MTPNQVTRQQMIDELVKRDLNIEHDPCQEWLEDVLRGGFPGYNTFTNDALLAEYQDYLDESVEVVDEAQP